PPLPPRTYAIPNHPVYLSGEAVTITCEVPSYAPIGRFQLQKGSVAVITSARHQQSLTYNISHVTNNDEGTYTCFYQTDVSGRWISSLPSPAVEVVITRAPPVPRIFLDPDYPVYVTGESVTLTCATPKANSIGRLRILKDATPVTSRLTEEHRRSLSYPYRYVSRENEGSYTCLYEIRMLGRWISSDSVATVQINVTDPLPPPAISLHPRHPIYLIGEDVSINCLLPMSYASGRFQWVLRRSVGDNTTTEIEKRRDSAANSFMTVNKDSDGNYTCHYEREVSGRWIPSIRSDVVAVQRLMLTAAVSMDQESGLYMEGSTARISCSAPNWNPVNSFRFYKDNLLLRSLPVGTDHPFASLTVSNLSHVNGGRYTCKCETTVWGRRLISRDSNSAFLTVADTFKPAISIRSSEVEIGGNVSITCRSRREHTGVSFFLQRDGETNFTNYRTASAGGHSATFTISNLTEGDLGAYSCGYKVMINGALLTSARSEPVEVTVHANSSTQMLFRYLYLAGVALLLVCVAAGVAATIKRRKKASFEGPFSLPDSATTLSLKGAMETADSTL
ncbi:cell adhesion molecule CEACAM5-like, partial [Cetorhinus maximus]